MKENQFRCEKCNLMVRSVTNTRGSTIIVNISQTPLMVYNKNTKFYDIIAGHVPHYKTCDKRKHKGGFIQ